ncbi:hypothetical protein ACFLW4_07010 [Chloroflexota bacterium]
MKWCSVGFLIIGLFILSACAGYDVTPPPTEISSPTPQPKPSPEPTPTPTPVPSPESTLVPTLTPNWREVRSLPGLASQVRSG